MTGLDIEKDQIIEMACLITDSELNVLAEVILAATQIPIAYLVVYVWPEP